MFSLFQSSSKLIPFLFCKLVVSELGIGIAEDEQLISPVSGKHGEGCSDAEGLQPT